MTNGNSGPIAGKSSATPIHTPHVAGEELPFHRNLAIDDVPAAELRLLELDATEPGHPARRQALDRPAGSLRPAPPQPPCPLTRTHP
ncbi:hypothetical protein ACQ4WX_48620 [Streptomyces lasalocidi]